MRRILALLLSCSMLLTGCSINPNENDSISESFSETLPTIEVTESTIDEISSTEAITSSINEAITDKQLILNNEAYVESLGFTSLDDPEYHQFIEDSVYSDLTNLIDTNVYQVENIEVKYISKDYIEELSYNSKENIYFGYTLSEISEVFGDEKFIITLGNDGQTTVETFQEYDDTYDKVIRNVAVGTGVILICVTVSVVSGGAGAPAVAMIFAASAKAGAIGALTGGAISGATTYMATYAQTGDPKQAAKESMLSASEGYMWGAITGVVAGGAESAFVLKMGTKGGLTMNEVAIITKNHDKLPVNFIKQIKNMDEYSELINLAEKSGITIETMAEISSKTKYPLEIVKMIRSTKEGEIYIEKAGLISKVINGKPALIRQIDLSFESELGGEMVTNLERMKRGYAAIDPVTEQAYELHHIGQSVDSPLAILSQIEHRGKEANSILHDVNIADGQGVHSLMTESEWAAQREEFWKGMYSFFTGG